MENLHATPWTWFKHSANEIGGTINRWFFKILYNGMCQLDSAHSRSSIFQILKDDDTKSYVGKELIKNAR